MSFLVLSAFPQTGEEQLPGPGISPPTCLVLELLVSVGCPALSRFTVSDSGCRCQNLPLERIFFTFSRRDSEILFSHLTVSGSSKALRFESLALKNGRLILVGVWGPRTLWFGSDLLLALEFTAVPMFLW